MVYPRVYTNASIIVIHMMNDIMQLFDMRRLAIVGSRDYVLTGVIRSFIRCLPADTVVYSGGARGVDTIAIEEAGLLGLKYVIFHARWDVGGMYDQLAGFKRNEKLVQAVDLVVAFWDGKSRGTADTIRRAHKEQRSVLVFGPDGHLMMRARRDAEQMELG